MFFIDDSGGASRGSCGKLVAVLNAETEETVESRKVYTRECSCSRRKESFRTKSWSLRVPEVFHELSGSRGTVFGGSDSCAKQTDVETRVSQNSEDIFNVKCGCCFLGDLKKDCRESDQHLGLALLS